MADYRKASVSGAGNSLADVDDTLIPTTSTLNVDAIIKKLLLNENYPNKQVKYSYSTSHNRLCPGAVR